ncbi:MAG: class I SAM-dependent methyltransferase [Acidobacteriota bacterium]|nr:class I SAM-dependent methyltransferase [Acidobacteriota bacterium]
METFDAEWLTLREPVDHQARAEDLVALLRERWIAAGWRQVMDLGSGTGSNLRYIAPRLPPGQSWTLVDHDPEHVRRLRRLVVPGGVETLSVVSGDLAVTPFGVEGDAAVDVVTGSALLDLVSEAWLTQLVSRCVEIRCAVYFGLSYDGVILWSRTAGEGDDLDIDPDDELVRDAINEHQRRDKGFGPALGPHASTMAATLLGSANYGVWLERSNWRLGQETRVLSGRLVDGWTRAATTIRPDAAGRILAWGRRRKASLAAGRSELTVGHRDLLALPPRVAE